MSSNTGKNRKPGTFTKGDPRINRKGRPRSFDALRKLAQQIAIEKAEGRDTTKIEQMLRDMAANKHDPRDRHKFIEIAYGKVPDQMEVSVPEGLTIVVERKHDEEDDHAVPETA